MKKIMALAFALFFATTAAAAESYPASQKIQQTVNGELKPRIFIDELFGKFWIVEKVGGL